MKYFLASMIILHCVCQISTQNCNTQKSGTPGTSECSCIKCIDFRDCMKKCDRQVRDEIKKLEFLRGNMATLPRFDSISTYNMVDEIIIRECSVQELLEDFFERFPNLSKFALMYNKNNIMSQHPVRLNLTEHKAISHIDLTKNQIEHFPEIQSGTLKILTLSGNQIKNLTAEHLKGLPKLTTLDLSHNNLTEIPDLQQEGLKVKLKGNPFSCSREIYGKFEGMRKHILTDSGLHCRDESGELIQFAGETGLSEFAKSELHVIETTTTQTTAEISSKKPMSYCNYSRTSKATCYCVNCPDYKTCLQQCHDYLDGKPEVIKLQEGNFPIIHKNPTSSASLERLTMSNCQIRKIAPDFFEPYPNLLRFAVFDNNLEDRAAPLHLNLTSNQALTRVELFSNFLTKLPRIRSESLEYLDVRFNRISNIQPEDLRALKKLKTLVLSHNHLTTIGPFEVAHLQVHLLNNDFPCTSATYCDFHKNRRYIVADYGVYCKYDNTTLTRFADEDGLLPDFQCPAPKKNVAKSQFRKKNTTQKIQDFDRSRSEFRLYPSPTCVILLSRSKRIIYMYIYHCNPKRAQISN